MILAKNDENNRFNTRDLRHKSDMPSILSIPQSNREVQKLAGDSLYGTWELAAVAVSG